jgi:sporulation protein YlmC with PRC-barrel domain
MIWASDAGAGGETQIAAKFLLGMTVGDARVQEVGQVVDLALDLPTSRIVEVFVDTKGKLTSDHRVVAVPPQLLTLENNPSALLLSGDLDAFESAPALNLSAWGPLTEPDPVKDTYARFHLPPVPLSGTVISAKALLGAEVQNSQNEYIGRVANLYVTMPGGQISHVLLAGHGPKMVPIQAVIFDVHRRIAVVK